MKSKSYMASIFAVAFGNTSVSAGDMTSVFGVEFGKPLPQNISSLEKGAIDSFRNVLEEDEVKEFSFILDKGLGKLIVPPRPNRHYTVYLAIITSLTNRVGALWARGPKSEGCVATNNLLAQHLMKKYDDIEASFPTSQDSRRRGVIWLRSSRLEIYFSCGALEVKDKALEKEFESELEQVVTERLREQTRTDTSGL